MTTTPPPRPPTPSPATTPSTPPSAVPPATPATRQPLPGQQTGPDRWYPPAGLSLTGAGWAMLAAAAVAAVLGAAHAAHLGNRSWVDRERARRASRQQRSLLTAAEGNPPS